jgi:MIP family channel proteins
VTGRPLWAAVAAEAIGTFTLVLAGCGAILIDQPGRSLGPLGVAAAFGLAIAIMVHAFGPVSGAHFNPAVSAALALDGRLPRSQVAPYWFAQVGGAIGAGLVLRATLVAPVAAAVTHPSVSVPSAFAWEAILTFFLVLVIAAVVREPSARSLAAVAIGGAVAVGALVGGPISGGSMNPARSLGPALVSGDLGDLWIYLAAPPIGGVLAVLAYRRLATPSVAA